MFMVIIGREVFLCYGRLNIILLFARRSILNKYAIKGRALDFVPMDHTLYWKGKRRGGRGKGGGGGEGREKRKGKEREKGVVLSNILLLFWGEWFG